MAIVEGIRNPLRGFYSDAIETKVLPGPNPAADLKHFIGKRAHRKGKAGSLPYFTQEEAPELAATARALCPRWSAFILTGLLAGLRWGESAALRAGDIDFKRGRIDVQRTWSDKAGRIEAPKDHEGRHVKASPALLAALRAHLEAMALEGQVQDWTPEQRALVFRTRRAGSCSTARSSRTSGSRSSPRRTCRTAATTPRATLSPPGCSQMGRTSGGCRASSGTRRSLRPPTPTDTSSRTAMRQP
jgi:integrase